ncbi:MAG TPA: FAD-binding protein, partial [Geminicoccaceae bacterium]
DALLRAVRAKPNVTLLEGCFAFDLLTAKGSVCGLLAYDDARGWLVLRSTRVVLASGGIGALYAETTNPPEATGDGLAMAARAGSALADLEFVQFHPTALDDARADGGRGSGLPLLSEALRGAGATLVDDRGERFLPAEDPRAELAPRDVVARAVFRRRAAGREVLLDLRPALRAHGADAFPAAVAACRRAGYEPEAAPVPVLPAAHYHMGGVLADALGRTSIPGLWACGEVAATGAHGANRLASNSLLEAVVSGGRVAADAATHCRPPCAAQPALAIPALPDPFALPPLRDGLRRIASRHLGVERDGAGLETALAEVAEVQRALNRLPAGRLGGGSGWLAAVRAYGELRNLRLATRLVATTAHAREESRGAHFRRDHPELRPEWCRRQIVTLPELASVNDRSPMALMGEAA